MSAAARIAPPHSLILVCDAVSGRIPDSMNQSLISATDSCVAIGCRAEDDGETEIQLGVVADVDPGEQPVFEGRIRTPSGKLVVRTVLGVSILETNASGAETWIRVWVNDLVEPDRVAIGVIR